MPRPGAVVVSLNGGVGNQLFQYAAGLALAGSRGARLQLASGRHAGTRSVGAIDLVDAPAMTLNGYERFLCGLPGGSFARLPPAARRAARAVARRASNYREIHQSLMQMADARVDPPADDRYVHLRGFFQHRSYYEPGLGAVVESILHKLEGKIDTGAGDGVAAVHFRRGDYLLHGYDLPLSFQEDALVDVAARHDLRRVLVMSDDHDFAILAAEHLERRGFPAQAAPPNGDGAELDDLCTLAAAQHLVMSNSTFVWWAAVLGDALRPDDRVVVCPTPWMPLRACATIPSASLDLSRPGWSLHTVRP